MKYTLLAGLLSLTFATHINSMNRYPAPTSYDWGRPTIYSYDDSGSYVEEPMSPEDINKFEETAKRFRNNKITTTVLSGAVIPAFIYGIASSYSEKAGYKSGRRLLTGLLLGWYGINTAYESYPLTQGPRVDSIVLSPYIGDQPFIHRHDERTGEVIGGLILTAASVAWLASAMRPTLFSRSVAHMRNHLSKSSPRKTHE